MTTSSAAPRQPRNRSIRIKITNGDGSVTTVEGLVDATVSIEVEDAKLSPPTEPQHQQRLGHRFRGAWCWKRRQNVQDGDGNLLTLVLFSRDATDRLGDPVATDTSDA